MASGSVLRVPVQARSQRTRAAVVEGARLEFSDRGYAATTARSIATRAGVGTGTFYHYFPDKDAVLREITDERVASLLAEAQALTSAPPDAADGGKAEAQALTSAPPDAADERMLVEGAIERLDRLVALYVEAHRADVGLHAVITERRLCDPDLDAIMSGAERTAVARMAAAISRWGYDGDAEGAAYMMFSLLEGAVHAHVLGKPVVSDARFCTALVEALLRIALPSALLPHSLHTKKETDPDD